MRSAKSGKPMPLDAKVVRGVHIRWEESLKTHVAEVAEYYTSHFATCPNADQHRKRPSAIEPTAPTPGAQSTKESQ
jgi:hypothetical protein